MATNKKAKASRNQTVSKIKDQLSAAGPKLGSVCYWDLEGVWVKVTDLEALYQKHNLSMDFFPPKVGAGAAFRKAMKNAAREFSGLMARPITKDGDIIWGVVREGVDLTNFKLDYDHHVTCTLERATETFKIEGKGEGLKLAQRAKDLYEELTETYTSWDIRRLLQRCIVDKLQGVTMRRRSGGFYFTLPHHDENLFKLQAVIDEIGDSDFEILDIPQSDRNVQSVGRETRRSLEGDLKEIQADLEEFKNKPPRISTMENRLSTFKDLKAKVETYASMLSIKVDDLNQGIDDCAQQMKKLIGQVEHEKENEERAKRTEKRAARHDLDEWRDKAKENARLRKVRKVK